jgi:aminoglycoside phosphotransferase (APT) family kinase protein
LQAHPDGPKVLNAQRMLGPGLDHQAPRLVHIDNQTGNILWKGERMSVVLDWEETTLGDPWIEVAYLYTQPAIRFLKGLAMKFHMAYEREFG